LWQDASVSQVHAASSSPWRYKQHGSVSRWHHSTTQKNSTLIQGSCYI
jgi:hypothetical protein